MIKRIIAVILSVLLGVSAIAISASAANEDVVFDLTAVTDAGTESVKQGDENVLVAEKDDIITVSFVVDYDDFTDPRAYQAVYNNIYYDTDVFEYVANSATAKISSVGSAEEQGRVMGVRVIMSSTFPYGAVEHSLMNKRTVFCTFDLKVKVESGTGYVETDPEVASMQFDRGAQHVDLDYVNLKVEIGEQKHVTGITVPDEEIELTVGEEYTVVPTITPSDATNKKVNYKSSDESVATVDENGKIVSVGAGEAEITVETRDGGHTATVTVTVVNPKVEITPTTKEMYVGEEFTFDTIVTKPDSATIRYHSNNTSAVQIQGDAVKVVKAVGYSADPVTVTVMLDENTSVFATCIITIKPDSIVISPKTATINVNATTQLQVTENMADIHKQGVTFNSSDESIATVSDTGLVTGITEGIVTITATSKYNTNLTDTSTITVSKQSAPPVGGGGGGGVPSHKITFKTPDGEELKVESKAYGTEIKIADYTFAKDGYIFEGIYTDEALTIKAEDFKVNKDLTLYVKFVEDDKPNVRPPSIPSALTDVHVAYIVGRGEGKVQPQASITRAEVATIFFRLLEDEIRDANYTKENNFTDVNVGDWFNTAVSTLAKLEILNGYKEADGTYSFRPNNPITRGEYATIVSRLASVEGNEEVALSDIADHWAYENILKATSLGWIKGYEDGTFRPTNDITRAEAMTLTNRVLCREPETVDDILSEEMVTFTDNADTSMWYYLAIQEATNSHEYKMKPDGKHETWTKLTETPDWTKLEKE